MGVSINTSQNLRFGRHEICAKKKEIVLKTKTNLLFVNQKTSKGKKEKKRKEMNKGTCTVNIYIHIYIYMYVYIENLRLKT